MRVIRKGTPARGIGDWRHLAGGEQLLATPFAVAQILSCRRLACAYAGVVGTADPIRRYPSTGGLTARLPTASALGKGLPPVASVYTDTSPEGGELHTIIATKDMRINCAAPPTKKDPPKAPMRTRTPVDGKRTLSYSATRSRFNWHLDDEPRSTRDNAGAPGYLSIQDLVELRGFEPLTSSMPLKRSPN